MAIYAANLLLSSETGSNAASLVTVRPQSNSWEAMATNQLLPVREGQLNASVPNVLGLMSNGKLLARLHGISLNALRKDDSGDGLIFYDFNRHSAISWVVQVVQ